MWRHRLISIIGSNLFKPPVCNRPTWVWQVYPKYGHIDGENNEQTQNRKEKRYIPAARGNNHMSSPIYGTFPSRAVFVA